MRRPDIQFDKAGRLKHFLTIEGVDRSMLTEILDTAESFNGISGRTEKKVPLLRDKVICNLFFENCTRTRTAFELAARRLSADVLNLNFNTSAATKGEPLLDTLRNLESMHVDMLAVRHTDSGAAHFLARHAASHVSIINAGDGHHAHPTQAMLDMFTIRRHKGDFCGLRVAIVGDILHSGIARSQILALNTLGTSEVRIIGPRTLLPSCSRNLGVHIFRDLEEGLRDVDVVIVLGLQKGLMQNALIPSEHEYFQLFGLTEARLAAAKEDAIVMHSGPVNRGVEMDSQVADGTRSVILQQVNFGIAVRMAVMSTVLGGQTRGADRE